MTYQMVSGSSDQAGQYSGSMMDNCKAWTTLLGKAAHKYCETVERRRAEAEMRHTPIERLRHLGIENARMHQAVNGGKRL